MWTRPDHPAVPPAAGPDGSTRQASEPVGDRTAERRICRPDMLMIGAFARNSGKTELACRIIRRHAAKAPVVGLKVTTVERTDGRCPHGDSGCGVCASHADPWIVSRERDRESAKDTCRLLASGSHEVYWLRVLRSELAGGAAALLSHVPEGRLSVCESNSLRRVVEPGLFLQVRSVDASECKPSARAVSHLADHVVVSDGRSFDLDLCRISIVDGQWALRREGTAVVIDDAKGRSEADYATALRRTRAALEAQFDRVFVETGTSAESPSRTPPTADAGSSEEWCLVASAKHGGVPPRVVNGMFRRRTEADVVVAAGTSDETDGCPVLCRRRLLSEVISFQRRGDRAITALRDVLRDGSEVRVVRLSATCPGIGPGDPASAVRRPAAEAL